METKPALAGLFPGEIAELLKPLQPFRAGQIHQWICKGAVSFADMNNLPAALRDELERRFRLFSGSVSAELEDPDGTVKFRISFEDSVKIESVILASSEGRKTACLSTQAGCPIGCVFCKTGQMGFTRDLSSREIIEELLFLTRRERGISHIVIMGMGEPLLNLKELRRAVAYFTDILKISKRRITLSTSGVTGGIWDFTDNGPDIRLALSLTTGRQELRERLMPVAQSNPLAELKESLMYYQQKRKRRITLEAVLLGGVNTTPADAAALAGFARGLDAVVNLIPWNPVDGLCFEGKPLRSPGAAETAGFASALKEKGLNVTFRYKKGRGVLGACGQLGQQE
ncbi:MAG: 23S rRNA (adenine(2503)-C(2))-methyltransferase RlmN [Treponema sp.]|jgi:23S rRNA (adenine2503-C2)-methyltransferase|nr:23S rRNA (adenine(2503)-C(2))-methyltransferase RlmN [Treponema sp.]